MHLERTYHEKLTFELLVHKLLHFWSACPPVKCEIKQQSESLVICLFRKMCLRQPFSIFSPFGFLTLGLIWITKVIKKDENEWSIISAEWQISCCFKRLFFFFWVSLFMMGLSVAVLLGGWGGGGDFISLFLNFRVALWIQFTTHNLATDCDQITYFLYFLTACPTHLPTFVISS